MSKLHGKVALITGGNSGIGFATAKKFIDEGAQVIITGRRQSAIEEALGQLGSQAMGFVGDVSKMNDLNRIFAQIESKKVKLDIVFANAGIAHMRHISEVDENHFDEHFNTNVKGLYFTLQKSLPLLNDGASIILNASAVHSKGFPNFSVYAATKAAVRSFARSLATDLKDKRIRVNTISPGPIETPIFSKMGLSEDSMKQMGEGFAQMVPLSRFGTPEEIANGVVFLASDDSLFVTGTDLSVDGGIGQV